MAFRRPAPTPTRDAFVSALASGLVFGVLAFAILPTKEAAVAAALIFGAALAAAQWRRTNSP